MKQIKPLIPIQTFKKELKLKGVNLSYTLLLNTELAIWNHIQKKDIKKKEKEINFGLFLADDDCYSGVSLVCSCWLKRDKHVNDVMYKCAV